MLPPFKGIKVRKYCLILAIKVKLNIGLTKGG